MPSARQQSDAWFRELRGCAEHILQSNGIRREREATPLQRELEVYEVELELQNEQLEKATHQLREARDYYARLFDHAPFAYVTLGRAGAVTNANVAAAALLGRSHEELLGAELSSFASASDALTVHRSLLETRTLGVARKTRARFRNAQGQELLLELEIRAEAARSEGGDDGAALFVGLISLPAGAEPKSTRDPGKSASQGSFVGGAPRDASAASGGTGVLLVDDSYATRLAIGEVLREYGHAVHEAASCADLDVVCGAIAEAPALALIDFMLLDGRGDEVAARLRRRWPAIFVLYFSASEPRESRAFEAALLVPRTALLSKPSDLDAVIEAIELHLQSAPRMTPPP